MSIDVLAGWLDYDPLQSAFLEALIVIILVTTFVTLSSKLGLGSVIGYLSAGVAGGALISLSFSAHPEELLHFAEFGVVLFLFVIGLEFSPSRLWELRTTIFGRGVVQVVASGLVLALPIFLFGLSWQASLVIGLGLALSSTALVISDIDKKGDRNTEYGRTAISVLLFEDLAIVPLLLLVAILASSGSEAQAGPLDVTVAIGIAIAATTLLVAFGRYLLEPILDSVAKTDAPELMTATALGVVIGSAGLMVAADLSPAMGAFIAGVMLAGSNYRHEIEADIEPFRGLFIGLFFLAVGLSLDLGAIVENLLLITIAVPLLIVLKTVVIYLISRLFASSHVTSLRVAFAMSQHGEFGFVLFSAAVSAALFDAQTNAIVVTIVTLSMIISSQSDRLLGYVLPSVEGETIDEDYQDADGDVLIVGFGRFGQIAAQPLLDAGYSVTLLDKDVARIREAEKFGTRVHFGDGRRLEVLENAGAKDARLVLVCVDDRQTTDHIVGLLSKHFPDTALVVRAWDRAHAISLAQSGVRTFERDTFQSALTLSKTAITLLGTEENQAEKLTASFAERDAHNLAKQIQQSKATAEPHNVAPERLAEPGAAKAKS